MSEEQKWQDALRNFQRRINTAAKDYSTVLEKENKAHIRENARLYLQSLCARLKQARGRWQSGDRTGAIQFLTTSLTW